LPENDMNSRSRLLVAFLFAIPLLLEAHPSARQTGDLVRDVTGIDDSDLPDRFEWEAEDRFGSSVARVSDLDGNGVDDLVVGVPWGDDGGHGCGEVWLLYLNGNHAVLSYRRISATEGWTGADVESFDGIGSAVAGLGDLDGNGVDDLAVGAVGDDDGFFDAGAVWILFLLSDGTVSHHQKISSTSGGFGGNLRPIDEFGASIASLGDLDGDGIVDLAVGSPADSTQTYKNGKIWILFLNADGTVKAHQEITEGVGGFGGDLDLQDEFGRSLAAAGDLDGDGVADLVVGAPLDDDGGSDRGAVWTLFLRSDGTVRSHQKISALEGWLGSPLRHGDEFGSSVTSPGDLDGDGVPDLVVGATGDNYCLGGKTGAAWILRLTSGGTVHSHQKICNSDGGFGGGLDGSDWFGVSSASFGDLDGDGAVEVMVGANHDDSHLSNTGAVWVLSLDSTGTCVGESRIAAQALFGELTDLCQFGSAMADGEDLDGDGIPDLLVGTPGAPGLGTERGGVLILGLDSTGAVNKWRRINDAVGGFDGELHDHDRFGAAVTRGHGFADIVVGAPGDDDGGVDRGAVWLLECDSDVSVTRESKISALSGGALATLADDDRFGSAVARLADLDGDGVDELAVGAPGADDGASGAGAVWILFPDANGALRSAEKIAMGSGGFPGTLQADDAFGAAVAAIGDRNGDGTEDLAVGSPGVDQGGPDRGAVWILHLDSSGGVGSAWTIAASTGGFDGALANYDRLGSSVAVGGDVNGDGVADLLVGAPGDDTLGVDRGATWLLCLDSGASVRSHRKIGNGLGGFPGAVLNPPLGNGDEFGSSCTSIADLDGDGHREWAAGAPFGDEGGDDRGEAYVLFRRSLSLASHASRNGSGVNPAIFSSARLPAIGGLWTSEVDAASIGAGGFVFLFVYAGPLAGAPTQYGEILLDPASPRLITDWTVAYGGVSHHSLAIPSDIVFAGLSATAQAYLSDVAPSGQLTNAIDLTFGF
jgi:hypothetical protein